MYGDHQHEQRVANTYGVMQWAMSAGEPGHTFVLIDRTGRVALIRDYDAVEHGGMMYVPPVQLVGLIEKRL